MAKEKSILDGGLLEIPEHATFEDLMKTWPKEPVIRQDPPVGVAKKDWEHIEREYQHFFWQEKQKKKNKR